MKRGFISTAGAALLGAVVGWMARPATFKLRHPSNTMLAVKSDRITRHVDFMSTAKQADVLFLGDSVTDFWRDVPDLFNERFPGARNCGVGYDRIENILWRVESGEVDAVRPKVVVLQCGANNLRDCDARQIVDGIGHLIIVIKSRQPGVRVLLVGLLPTDLPGPDAPEKVRAANAGLSKIAGVTFIDLSRLLLNPDGSFNESLQPDHLHPSPAGYRVWADAIKEPLANLLR